MRSLVLFLLFSGFSFGQWSAVFSVPNNGLGYSDLRSISFSDSQHGSVVGVFSTDSASYSNIYLSNDGGDQWLNSFTTDFTLYKCIRLNAQKAVAVGRKVNGTTSVLSCAFTTQDGGLTWQTDTIANEPFNSQTWFFKLNFAMRADGVGLVTCGFDIYQTQDGGQTWFNSVAQGSWFNPVLLGNDFSFFNDQNVVQIDPLSLVQTTYPLGCACIGTSLFFGTYNEKVLRIIQGTNGSSLGYNSSFYGTVTISSTPFDAVLNLHLPGENFDTGIATSAAIFLTQNGQIYSSTDNGASFFMQESSGFDTSNFKFTGLYFVNDSLGFAIGWDAITEEYYIVKTTNAGGSTNNVVFNPIQILSLPESKQQSNIEVYPNPAANQINIPVAFVEAYSTYRIYSSDGKVVQAGLASEQIDIAHLQTGNYILVIDSQTQKRYAKVLVVR
ncbi:MAG: T9SS type A sorting domain-containing protein [Flavobacteriales bacterium]